MYYPSGRSPLFPSFKGLYDKSILTNGLGRRLIHTGRNGNKIWLKTRDLVCTERDRGERTIKSQACEVEKEEGINTHALRL